MRYLTLLILVISLFACNQESPQSVAGAGDFSGYQLNSLSKGIGQRAVKLDANQNVIEEGFIQNGLKQGLWITYESDGEFPITMINYIDGMANGIYLEFNERGQVKLKANYKDNKLHGAWGKYRFGRAEETANYKGGQLDGIYKVYYQRDGKIQSETSYKDGVQDGPYRFYNEEGQVTLEYIYKNGEKVSGGIVEPAEEADGE